MKWQEFLQKKPILTLAREGLDDENFLRFLQTLWKAKTPAEFKDSLAWHAFEEIGWPEGKTYCFEGSAEYCLSMAKPPNLPAQISSRLVLRQEHWKSKKEEHMAAHQCLLALLPPKLQEAQLLSELLPA